MRKLYFVLLAVSTALLIVLTIPGIALVFAFMTLGIGLVLISPLPNLTLSLWVFFPAVLYWHRPKLRYALLALAGLVILAFKLVPPMLSEAGVARDLATSVPATSAPYADAGPIGIEVHRPFLQGQHLRREGDPDRMWMTGHPCAGFCERLLLAGDVDWIRVVMTSYVRGADKVIAKGLLVRADGPTCARVNPDLAVDRPCVLFDADHERPADLLLQLKEVTARGRPSAFLPYYRSDLVTVTAYQGPDAEAALLFRLVRVHYQQPTGSFIINAGALGQGSSGGGLSLSRDRRATAPIDLARALEDIGLSLAPLPENQQKPFEQRKFMTPPPDAQAAGYVASLLRTGLETREAWGKVYKKLVIQWRASLIGKAELTEADREIFCLSLAEDDMRDGQANTIMDIKGFDCDN